MSVTILFMVTRIADIEFTAGDAVTFNGKPAVFVSRTVKHREIEQDGRRLFVAARRVSRPATKPCAQCGTPLPIGILICSGCTTENMIAWHKKHDSVLTRR